MSHFISGVNLQGSLVFHLTPPEIVKPKMRRFLKTNAIQSIFSQGKEGKIVDHVCQRYSQMEQENLKVEKELFISNKCQVLKKKFRSAFNTRASGRSVQNFFKDEELSLMDRVHQFPMNLKELTAKMPRKLELQKKYHSNICIKMMSIQQAGLIAKQKEEYRNWLNFANNCASSPNLNKMAFLFEQLDKKNRKLKTENSQRELPEVELAFSANRRTRMLDSILKENSELKTYAKKHRKPYSSLDKQSTRLSIEEPSLLRF